MPTPPDQGPSFTPDSLVVEAESRCDWEALKALYRERGIKCLNCPAAEAETFAQAADLHGFDLTEHLRQLNALALSHPFVAWPPTRAQRFKAWLGRILQDK